MDQTNLFLISIETVGFSVHGEKGFAREPVGHLFQALPVLDEQWGGEKWWIHGAIIPVSGRYRSKIGEWAADGFQMPAWHKVGEWPLNAEEVDDVMENIQSLGGSDSPHNCSGNGQSGGMNRQLIQLNEIGDFGCRESESVLSYAARKT